MQCRFLLCIYLQSSEKHIVLLLIYEAEKRFSFLRFFVAALCCVVNLKQGY